MFITFLCLYFYRPQVDFLAFSFVDKFDQAGRKFAIELFELFVIFLFLGGFLWNEGYFLQFGEEHSTLLLGEEIWEQFRIFFNEVNKFFWTLNFFNLMNHLVF